MITLRDLTQDNIFKVIKLWDTLEDSQKKSVAPNVVSIAQAYVNLDRAWPKAIYLFEEPIGFVMVALKDEDIPNEDQPAYFLWRFMMERSHQNHGYGKMVLDLIKEKCIKDGIQYLYVSCTMHEPMPYQFYIRYGFVDTHEMDDDEQILKMKISI